MYDEHVDKKPQTTWNHEYFGSLAKLYMNIQKIEFIFLNKSVRTVSQGLQFIAFALSGTDSIYLYIYGRPSCMLFVSSICKKYRLTGYA